MASSMVVASASLIIPAALNLVYPTNHPPEVCIHLNSLPCYSGHRMFPVLGVDCPEVISSFDSPFFVDLQVHMLCRKY